VEARLDLRHDGGRQEVALEAEGQELAAGELGTAQRVQLEGTISDALGTPSLRGTLVAQGVRQDDLQLTQARLEASGDLAALTVTAALEGRMLEPFTLETQAVLALADEAIGAEVASLAGTVAGEPFRLLAPLELRLADEAIVVEGLALDLAGGRLEGRLRLADTVDLEASLQELPLRLLEAFGGPPLIGIADASLRASGSATNPTANLDLWVRGAGLDQPDYADLPPLDLTATAALAERRLGAELRASGLTAEPIVAELDLPLVVELQPFVFALPEDGEIGGRLDAALDLATVTEFVDLPDQSLSGAFRAQLSLGGTLAEPLVGGDVTLDNGRYDNGMTGTTLRNVTLRAEARQRQLTIVEVTATDGGRGRITGEGAVAIEPLAAFPFELEVGISNAELVRREDVRAVLGGRVALAGDASAAMLSGRIRINEATMSVPDATGPALPVIDVEEIGADVNDVVEEPAPVAPPFALDLDLVVEVPGQVFVRGLGLDSEWQGQLEIRGPATEPVVVGSLEIRRGHFDFLDKRFDLRRGVIEFTGAVPPEPIIDVEAAARGRNITGIVRLFGPVGAPVLSLESEPPLPEDEILAQLLFDQSIEDITPGQAASLAIAINRLRGGPVGFDPLGDVRDRLGLDRLEVTGALGDPGIAAGRYLTDEIFIGVETGTAEAAGRAEVEIDVLPGLSLQADVTEEGRSGVGIRWRFDY
jgi:translocation and assembly module TamB